MLTTIANPQASRRHARRPPLVRLLPVAGLLLLSAACAGGGSDAPSSKEPWGANVVEAADLVKELASADKPIVVCTAPPFMYRTGHVPGAVLHGPTIEPAVIRQLTEWAQTLPRTTNLVIYCGCCPLSHCPNLRPAYTRAEGTGLLARCAS